MTCMMYGLYGGIRKTATETIKWKPVHGQELERERVREIEVDLNW